MWKKPASETRIMENEESHCQISGFSSNTWRAWKSSLLFSQREKKNVQTENWRLFFAHRRAEVHRTNHHPAIWRVTAEIRLPEERPTVSIHWYEHLDGNCDKLTDVECGLGEEWETPCGCRLTGASTLLGVLPPGTPPNSHSKDPEKYFNNSGSRRESNCNEIYPGVHRNTGLLPRGKGFIHVCLSQEMTFLPCEPRRAAFLTCEEQGKAEIHLWRSQDYEHQI